MSDTPRFAARSFLFGAAVQRKVGGGITELLEALFHVSAGRLHVNDSAEQQRHDRQTAKAVIQEIIEPGTELGAGIKTVAPPAGWDRIEAADQPQGSRCDKCGEFVSDIDAGFSPSDLGMQHADCGGTWRRV